MKLSLLHPKKCDGWGKKELTSQHVAQLSTSKLGRLWDILVKSAKLDEEIFEVYPNHKFWFGHCPN